MFSVSAALTGSNPIKDIDEERGRCMTAPTKKHALRLCPQGLELWQKYESLALEFSMNHPQASAAWDDFIRHYRGTSSHKGCSLCNKKP